MKWLMLLLGGGIGTVSRHLVSGAAHQMFGAKFPYGTFAVNILGCFLIGLIVSLAQEKFVLTDPMKLFLIVGFLGAFTTFSTFIFETSTLIKSGSTLLALANVLVSVLIGFFIFEAGVLLGKNI